MNKWVLPSMIGLTVLGVGCMPTGGSSENPDENSSQDTRTNQLLNDALINSGINFNNLDLITGVVSDDVFQSPSGGDTTRSEIKILGCEAELEEILELIDDEFADVYPNEATGLYHSANYDFKAEILTSISDEPDLLFITELESEVFDTDAIIGNEKGYWETEQDLVYNLPHLSGNWTFSPFRVGTNNSEETTDLRGEGGFILANSRFDKASCGRDDDDDRDFSDDQEILINRLHTALEDEDDNIDTSAFDTFFEENPDTFGKSLEDLVSEIGKESIRTTFEPFLDLINQKKQNQEGLTQQELNVLNIFLKLYLIELDFYNGNPTAIQQEPGGAPEPGIPVDPVYQYYNDVYNINTPN